QVAREVGLEIPETLVTNDPGEARAFWEAHRPGVIYKSFLGTPKCWRETRLLRGEEISLLPNVQYAPVIFQKFVAGRCDLRITVVGEEVFAAEIQSADGEYPVDSRMDMTVTTVAHSLPHEVATRLMYLLDVMGLEYGAIDMRLTPKGQYIFLEINPAGQYL